MSKNDVTKKRKNRNVWKDAKGNKTPIDELSLDALVNAFHTSQKKFVQANKEIKYALNKRNVFERLISELRAEIKERGLKVLHNPEIEELQQTLLDLQEWIELSEDEPGIQTPSITIQGDRLRHYGFEAGDKVDIKLEPNRITIMNIT